MDELPDDLYAEIVRLSEEGNELLETFEYRAALARFNQAYKLVPDPKQKWNATTWLMAAIGDGCFGLEDFEQGRKALAFGMQCPDGLGNPFMHLRLGQCEYELGNLDRAADELARAYLQEGKKIFSNDDQKYLDFVKAKLNPPPGGWPQGW